MPSSGIQNINSEAINHSAITKLILPNSSISYGNNALKSPNLKKVFMQKAPYAGTTIFSDSLEDLYVPYRQDDAKPTAFPWGATNATIHYTDENWMNNIEELYNEEEEAPNV